MEKKVVILIIICFVIAGAVIIIPHIKVNDRQSYNKEKETISIDERINEIEKEAKKKADKAFEITDGDIYSAAIKIWENVELTDIDGSLNIAIYLDKTNPEDDANTFFNILNKLCDKIPFEENYNSISFTLFVDKDCISMLTLTNYKGPSSFTCFGATTFNDDYESFINESYDNNFLVTN